MLAAAPAALVADLHRRLATAHEKLGRDEDAYQTLVAADRLHRGHLLIKLALGENRYKARRWREAALHLSPLAAHEDAARYPTRGRAGPVSRRARRDPLAAPREGGRALHARARAQAELRARAAGARRDRDGARRPRARPPICSTRQATATEEPAERLKLFEALGDMALHDAQGRGARAAPATPPRSRRRSRSRRATCRCSRSCSSVRTRPATSPARREPPS